MATTKQEKTVSIVIAEQKGMIRATPNGLIEETYFTVRCPREDQVLSVQVVINAIFESKSECRFNLFSSYEQALRCVRYFERKYKTGKHDIIRVGCEN